MFGSALSALLSVFAVVISDGSMLAGNFRFSVFKFLPAVSPALLRSSV